eukprot:GHVU01018227.1.p1 GENE.GHVU01018227.1~~GHVU01018227.1.p1  ORF type:complete len:135 (-),score=3.09 GHVU01018227.1:253-657(-)
MTIAHRTIDSFSTTVHPSCVCACVGNRVRYHYYAHQKDKPPCCPLICGKKREPECPVHGSDGIDDRCTCRYKIKKPPSPSLKQRCQSYYAQLAGSCPDPRHVQLGCPSSSQSVEPPVVVDYFPPSLRGTDARTG